MRIVGSITRVKLVIMKFLQNRHTMIFATFIVIPAIPLFYSLQYQRQREEDFVFLFFNAAFLYLPLLYLKRYKFYVTLVSFLLALPAFFDFAHIFLYQGRISESTFFIIFDTNLNEAREFWLSNFTWKFLFLILIYWFVVIYLLHFSITRNYEKPLSDKPVRFILFMIILPFIGKLLISLGDLSKTAEAYRRSNHLVSMLYNYHLYRKNIRLMSDFASKQQNNIKASLTEPRVKRETHLLIVGESTTRNHMSVYGYHRNTTPNLSALANKGVIFFDNVISAAPPSTVMNLRKIMTLATSENDSDETTGISLINVLKAAGFTTFWISNQYITGAANNTTTVVAKQSNKYYFLNTTDATSYDEKILPILKAVLADEAPRKFIVIHMIGAHMIYRYRYPKEFNYFTNYEDIPRRDFHNKEQLTYINQYDNAIRYHDYILFQIMNEVMNLKVNSSIVYLSDHGEEVYDKFPVHGHPGNLKSSNLYEIPFFIWTSWKNDFAQYRSRPYVSDETFHTILDLLKVHYEKFNAKNSIINKNFKPKKRPMEDW